MNKPHWLHTGWSTHRGRRPVNEDAVLVNGSLLAVADGVGGAPRGDLASVEALDTVRDAIDEPSIDPSSPAVASELTAALLLADEAVTALADRWSELRGTATTMCAAFIFADATSGPRTVIANVGDSRCYHIRDGQAHQVTTDQTLATQLQLAGRADVPDHADNIVTSIIGGPASSDTTIHLYRLNLQPNDSLLLCTDGVSNVVEPDRLAELCTIDHGRPSEASAALVREAWKAGSTDNITAAIANITKEE